MSIDSNTGALIGSVLTGVRAELCRAIELHPEGFHSGHEGWAVIKEDLDELWEEVRANRWRGQQAIDEAIQVAAMAVRYVVEANKG